MSKPSAEVVKPLHELTQARYERQLLNEMYKLQAALAEERTAINAQKVMMENEARQEADRKTSEADKARKLRAMELAIEQAQKDEQRVFNRKQAAAEKRKAEADAQAERERKREARKKEQQRQLAQKLHEESLARAAEERRQAEDGKRLQDSMKERKLQERLVAERLELQERNSKKAEEAAAKVERAALQRVQMTQQQRQAYAQRHAAQEERAERQRREQEARAEQSRKEAERRRQLIQRTQQQQAELEEARRMAILNKEERKQQELDRKAAEEREARARMQYERNLQEAASRNRVEQTMGALQAQLSTLEDQLAARTSKVDDFVEMRNYRVNEAQRLAVHGSLERTALTNSMNKIRENLTNKKLAITMPTDRRNIKNPELKALLKRMDAGMEGQVSSQQMRKTLSKLLPPEEEAANHMPKRLSSQSLPSLSKSMENLQLSRYDRVVAAFQAIDTDGSGSISKRELYNVLKTAGLSNGKQALEVFQGADQDDDGTLSFEEFKTIAKAIC